MLASIHPSVEEFPPLTESDPTAFSPPGSFGPFRVLHQIGTGVLGPVFRTYEPARDRLVAVKAFRLDLTPERARALADELQHVADAGLDHPSIVQPISAGVEGTVAYAASEYVAAESLDIALRHYAPATLDKVLPFITQLAGAIDFARAAGIGHGALHPRDIFVTPDEARATGFGVVQALERVGARAPIRRPYTAPERVDGSEWGVAADVYSLAAIAYELLTARRPAGAGIAISPADVETDHADLVAAALAQALAEDPRARHQSALSLAASLEAAARGERTSAREPLFLEIPQEPSHDLVIEPFENVERPPDREFDDIQLREERPLPGVVGGPSPVEPPSVEPAPREEPAHLAPVHEASPAREEPAGEEHVEQPPVGPAGHEFVGTLEREPLLFDAAPAEPRHEPASLVRGEPEPEEHAPALAPVAPFRRDPEPEISRREPDKFEFTSPPIEPQRAPAAPRREPPDRQRPVLLPVALTLLLGLFVGFLAGYLVGSRDHDGGADKQAAAKPETVEPAVPVSAPRAAPPPRSTSAPVATPAQKSAAPRAAESTRPTPVAPERTTPAVGGARLAVRSTPPGAQVFVNGRRRGLTPLAIRNLTAGTYTVRLERRGYTPETRRVTLAANGARDVVLTLNRSVPERPQAPQTFVGSMYLDSRPRGARVFVDGKPMGETPMQIPEIRAGAHAIRFELAGHRPWSTSATVVAGEVARVTGSLERQP